MRLARFLILMGGILSVPTGTRGQSAESYEPAGAGLPLFRPQGSVSVVARATSRWVPVPTDPHDLLGAYQYLPPSPTDDTRGQVFEVMQGEVDRMGSESIPRFVGVPWTVGCGCAEEGWDEPDWVPPGDTVVFVLSPTRKRTPWDGPPVFDVLGWHQPYPVGEFVPYWRWTRKEPERWLTVREFFSLLSILPAETAFRLDPSSSLKAVRGWLEENPGREESFPIPTILRELERLTAGG
jgi:hypothetical protein